MESILKSTEAVTAEHALASIEQIRGKMRAAQMDEAEVAKLDIVERMLSTDKCNPREAVSLAEQILTNSMPQ